MYRICNLNWAIKIYSNVYYIYERKKNSMKMNKKWNSMLLNQIFAVENVDSKNYKVAIIMQDIFQLFNYYILYFDKTYRTSQFYVNISHEKLSAIITISFKLPISFLYQINKL